MIKPIKCPHCYNENIDVQVAVNKKGKKFYRCMCYNCNVVGKYWNDTQREAIEFWNDGVICDAGSEKQ